MAYAYLTVSTSQVVGKYLASYPEYRSFFRQKATHSPINRAKIASFRLKIVPSNHFFRPKTVLNTDSQESLAV